MKLLYASALLPLDRFAVAQGWNRAATHGPLRAKHRQEPVRSCRSLRRSPPASARTHARDDNSSGFSTHSHAPSAAPHGFGTASPASARSRTAPSSASAASAGSGRCCPRLALTVFPGSKGTFATGPGSKRGRAGSPTPCNPERERLSAAAACASRRRGRARVPRWRVGGSFGNEEDCTASPRRRLVGSAPHDPGGRATNQRRRSPGWRARSIRSSVQNAWRQIRVDMRQPVEQRIVAGVDWYSDPWLVKGATPSGLLGAVAPTWNPPDALDEWPAFDVERVVEAIGVAAQRTRREALAGVPEATVHVGSGDAAAAVERFVQMESEIQRHGDVRMVQGEHLRAWLTTATGAFVCAASCLTAACGRRGACPGDGGSPGTAVRRRAPAGVDGDEPVRGEAAGRSLQPEDDGDRPRAVRPGRRSRRTGRAVAGELGLAQPRPRVRGDARGDSADGARHAARCCRGRPDARAAVGSSASLRRSPWRSSGAGCLR